MSQVICHSRPESGFDYLQKQLKHLEMYKYELGTENIQARMRSDMDSLIVDAVKCGDEIWGLPCADSEDRTESETDSKVVQAYEHGDEVGLRLGNFEDSRECSPYSKVVQVDKGEDLQVIENIQCPTRSAVRSKVVQINGEYQQGIENI